MAGDIQTVQEAVTQARQELEAAQEALVEAQRNVDAANDAVDAAIAERDGPRHPHQDQIDRMAYIRRQAEQRAERAGKSAAILSKLGADISDLDPRSPIDKAMARKAARGTARPQLDHDGGGKGKANKV